MRPYKLRIPAGEQVEIIAPGNYLRVKSAAVPVLMQSPENSEEAELDQGDAIELSPFNRLLLSHSDAAEQTVIVYIGRGTSMVSSQVGGSVTVSGTVEVANDTGNPLPTVATPAVAMSQAAATVGVASAQLLAAKPARKFLMVQNNDATANVYLNLSGAAATVEGGVKIAPGGSLLLDVATPSAAITAIADVATAGNAVTVVEG